MAADFETIAAITTPPGRGGVGILRISGSLSFSIAKNILKKEVITPRFAHYAAFYDKKNQLLDKGIALYFKAPFSYTGEDVLELQAHGGPFVLDRLLQAALDFGAVQAKPGEFTQRAFLNDKLDLLQAEAVADLINAESEQAAISALQVLEGRLSDKLNALEEKLINLRIYVEASIDFPEEEIDFLAFELINTRLNEILSELQIIINKGRQGQYLREGLTLVLAGKPNAGKSTLLNALLDEDRAIVTDIPGTTRDVMKAHCHLDELPLTIVDTAGIRITDCIVEQEGIKRARIAMEKANKLLIILDISDKAHWQSQIEEIITPALSKVPVLLICNKMDKTQDFMPEKTRFNGCDMIYLSAKTGEGLSLLKQTLKEDLGYKTGTEGLFLAKKRHLTQLEAAEKALLSGKNQLEKYKALECLAEDLKLAGDHLGEITGKLSADDLLGKIFADFCIGK